MHNPKALLAAVLLLLILSSCADRDSLRCLPGEGYFGDYVRYKYDGHRRPVSLEYYHTPTSTAIDRKYDLAYNASGQLHTVTLINPWVNPQEREKYVIEYDNNGFPSAMEHSGLWEGKEVTEFSHDGGILQTATTNFVHPAFPSTIFRGSTRFEYENGNVTKVFFTVRTFEASEPIEVLARENHTFDNKPVFYAASGELATMNIYCFGYLPNKNNVLKSAIIWESYSSHYSSPVLIEFHPRYDDEGRITANDYGYYSEFSGLTYTCK